MTMGSKNWLMAGCLVILSTLLSGTSTQDLHPEQVHGPPLPQTFRGLRPEVRKGPGNTSRLMLGEDELSFHPTSEDNAPFVVSQYSITCCRNGEPQPDPSLAEHIHEWSQEMVGVERNKTCQRFNGYYSVPSTVMKQQKKVSIGVRCKCPNDGNLDRNCRYLPDCANGGYRSFSINLRCVCPPKWFGDLCEKFCLNGELYKDFATPSDDGLGVDRCRCMKNFFGELCDDVQCFNGGTPVKNRACVCVPPYMGLHCEDLPAGMHSPDLPLPGGSSFHRDLSSTIVSLFLAVALALGVYFLVRRRTQWMRRRIQARRAMMIGGGGGEDGTSSAANSMAGAPPMYTTAGGGATSPQAATADGSPASMPTYDVNNLPPPPAYNEVVKLPPTYADARLQQVAYQVMQEQQTQESSRPPHVAPAPAEEREGTAPSTAQQEAQECSHAPSHATTQVESAQSSGQSSDSVQLEADSAAKEIPVNEQPPERQQEASGSPAGSVHVV